MAENFFAQFHTKEPSKEDNYFAQFHKAEEPPAAPAAAPPQPVEIEDPFERAAYRQRRGVLARQEGPVTRAIEKAPEVVGQVIKNIDAAAARVAGRQLGEPVQGEDVVNLGLTTLPLTPVARTGRGIAQAYLPQQAKSELGVDIPLAATHKQGVPLSNRPIIGQNIRDAAQTARGQLREAGETAIQAERPIGAEQAGKELQGSVAAALKEGRINPSELSVPIEARMSNQGAFDTMLSLGRSSHPADQATLARLRSAVTKTDWDEVVAPAMLQRLARSETSVFDPLTFTKNWNGLTPQAKNIIAPGTARHLDTLAEVSGAFETKLARLAREPAMFGGSSPMQVMRTAARAGLGIVAPLTLLGTVVRPTLLANKLAKPAGAASIAQWSKAYQQLIDAPGSKALAGFNLATRNLGNTLGTDIDPRQFLQSIRDGLPQGE